MPIRQHFDVLIIGGGCAGITVAAQLRRQRPQLTMGIIEPSEVHFYQPLFTLIGGGTINLQKAMRPTANLIPKGVIWIKDKVTTMSPAANEILTSAGEIYSYHYLVVCPGLQMDWQKIKGLAGNVGKNGIVSNYDPATVEQTWAAIKGFHGGHALFTFPNTPVKCAGAPQKIMYLAEDYFRKNGIRGKCQVSFFSAGKTIFAVQKYAEALNKILKKREINTQFQYDLVELEPSAKRAHFKNLVSGEIIKVDYDFIHVTPPMSAPDFVKQSPLANASGWVDVDKQTLNHVAFANVYALGDASSLPTSRTGAAVRKQAPVLVANLLSRLDGKPPQKTYNGYTSCPIVTGYGKLILAEFDYDGKPCETFPFNQATERFSMYMLKRYVLPKLYWHGMLKGWTL